MGRPEINGLPLPSLLVELLEEHRWRHPGDELLRHMIPFLREPVDFLMSIESMRQGSGALALFVEPRLAKSFHMARGSTSAEPVRLPWLDVELSVFVAVNRYPGDDLAIALDYRTDATDPRVVASDWGDGRGCEWREVALSFSEFTHRMEAST